MPADRSADRHVTTRRPIGISDADWNDLGELVGDRNRAEVIRQLVRAFLKRPGVRMPRRGGYEKRRPDQ